MNPVFPDLLCRNVGRGRLSEGLEVAVLAPIAGDGTGEDHSQLTVRVHRQRGWSLK